jgi:hypothetical protein
MFRNAICESKPEGRRKAGRYTLRLLVADVENIGSEVFTAVNMKSNIFWEMTPCSLVRSSPALLQNFGELVLVYTASHSTRQYSSFRE